jgi:hypothetical protein
MLIRRDWDAFSLSEPEAFVQAMVKGFDKRI